MKLVSRFCVPSLADQFRAVDELYPYLERCVSFRRQPHDLLLTLIKISSERNATLIFHSDFVYLFAAAIYNSHTHGSRILLQVNKRRANSNGHGNGRHKTNSLAD